MHEYQDKAGIRKRYNELFQSRDGIRFHIAWAQSRGDNDEVNSMMKELKKIDKASLTNNNYLRQILAKITAVIPIHSFFL